MSAETEARKLAAGSPRRNVFEHLVLVHAVRVDRKRYLPGFDDLMRTHANAHGIGRGGTYDHDDIPWRPLADIDHAARASTTPTVPVDVTSDELDALVREWDRAHYGENVSAGDE